MRSSVYRVKAVFGYSSVDFSMIQVDVSAFVHGIQSGDVNVVGRGGFVSHLVGPSLSNRWSVPDITFLVARPPGALCIWICAFFITVDDGIRCLCILRYS